MGAVGLPDFTLDKVVFLFIVRDFMCSILTLPHPVAQVNCKDRRGLLADVISALKSFPLEVSRRDAL